MGTPRATCGDSHLSCNHVSSREPTQAVKPTASLFTCGASSPAGNTFFGNYTSFLPCLLSFRILFLLYSIHFWNHPNALLLYLIEPLTQTLGRERVHTGDLLRSYQGPTSAWRGVLREGVSGSCRNNSQSHCESKLVACALLEAAFQPAYSLYFLFSFFLWRSTDSSLSPSLFCLRQFSKPFSVVSLKKKFSGHILQIISPVFYFTYQSGH